MTTEEVKEMLTELKAMAFAEARKPEATATTVFHVLGVAIDGCLEDLDD